ncbi:MAG: hypothetical protein GX262_11020 [Clostridia bacterium]|nr:hypothetical protein [Clostridia bacterium]
MKYEWRKAEKELYLPKTKPTPVEVPRQKFFMIKGQGNPNETDFAERIGVLYSLAYAVRMMPKNGFAPEGYFEYTVYPLEGIWDLTEVGRKSSSLMKDQLVYTIMIRQPDFVNQEVAERAFAIAGKKKPHPLLKESYFGEMEDGLCVQMLHIGSYDDEPKTFAAMEAFMAENKLKRRTLVHREIYLSDFRKTPTEKLKTVLRVFVSDS